MRFAGVAVKRYECNTTNGAVASRRCVLALSVKRLPSFSCSNTVCPLVDFHRESKHYKVSPGGSALTLREGTSFLPVF